MNENVLSPEAHSALPSSTLAYPAPENTTTDSTTNMSLPLNSSGSNSPDVGRESLLSPTQAISAHLPSKPLSNVSSAAATPNLNSSESSAPAPRMRGGFEVDDDEEPEDVETGKDEVDVYDPTAGFDVDALTPTAAVQTPLDRTTQSPEQENGTTPVPVQASGSLDGVSSSTLVTSLESPAVSAAIPTQNLVEIQLQATPSRSDVNGSHAPPVPRSRLSNDVIGILEDRIKDDPRGDTEAYLELIKELKSRNKENEVRKVYDDYLTVFPLDVSSNSC